MHSLKSLTLTLGAAMLALAPTFSQASTNLVSNGSFESVPFSMSGYDGSYCYLNSAIYTCSGQLPGWEGSVAPVMTSNSGAWGASPNTAADKFQIGLQNTSFIQQSVSIASAGSYVLNWSDAPRTNWGGAETYEVRFDGVLLSTLTPASSQGWNLHSATFTTGSGSKLLTFQGLNSSGDSTAFIDNVSLTAAVPEPETWALMLAGVAGLGFWSRRRSA
jgi:hypothetical protein